MKVNARGNFIFTATDTGRGLYSPSGATRVKIVSGLTPVPVYAADGSLNIILNSLGVGYYHASGAIRVTPASTQLGSIAPDGSIYAEGVLQALIFLSAYSPTNGLAAFASDNSLVIQDTVTPANNYTGPLLNADGTINKFTFTRASVGTYINSTGLVTVAANDRLRVDYSKGYAALLIETQETNTLVQSENFTLAPWTLDNVGAVNPIVTANAGIAPDGTMTADRIVFDKTGGTFSRIQQNPSVAPALIPSMFSVWMKTFAGGTSNIGLRGDGVQANYVVTGAWQRFVLPFTPTVTGVCQILLFDAIPGNDETADLLVWGADFKPGSVLSSYIPTVLTAVTREADVLTLPASAVPSLLTNSTLYARATVTSILRGLLGHDDGTVNNRFEMRRDTSVVSSGGVTAGSALSGMAVNDPLEKLAIFGNNSEHRIYNSGAQVGAVVTPSPMPLASTTLRVGTIVGTGNVGGALFLSEFAFLPLDATPAQLAVMTT